ncbi:MAG TPA: sugar phosphate isomerase/epimerase family protein [Chthonomonadaceae bacterium]|nr:sugar phosphate isomerase/epimerase family protein [Chthonomonadaceae bacterium]
MKRISIGTWAYTIGPYAAHPVPFEEVVEKLAALGFDGLDLGSFPPHPTPDAFPTRAARQELRKRVEEKGLTFAAIAPDLWSLQLINTSDNSVYLDHFRTNLQFAFDLGIDCFRIDTVQPPTIFQEVPEPVARERVVNTWRVASQNAADLGIRVVWEFEPGFAFNKPSDILGIIEEVGHPNFYALFDTCHAHMCAAVGARQPGERETLPGGALELAQKLRGKIGHIHLIDSDGTLHDDETSTHAPFGDGVLDFDALLPELNQSGCPCDWWTIDLCFWPDAWAVTERCKAAVDRLNEKYG